MRSYYILFLLSIITVFGCSEKKATDDILGIESKGLDGGIYSSEPTAEAADFEDTNVSKEKQDGSADTNIEEKIIKNAELRYPVEDIEKSYTALLENIKKNGGTIQNDNSGFNYHSLYRNLTIRVPSKNFDALLNSISKDVPYFDRKSISSLNVTEEFIDIEARLKTRKSLENRYLELLKNTSKISDIIEIEKSLSKVREDIESVQGRLNYLKQQVSYSTITIEIYIEMASNTGVTKSYPVKIWNNFVSGFNSISSFFLNLVYIWPYLLIIVLIIVFTRKKVFKRRKQKDSDN